MCRWFGAKAMETIFDRKLRWALLVSVLAVSACDLGPSSGSSSKGGSPRGASAFSPSNDPRKDLRDALEKLNSAYPYRINQVWSQNVNGRETQVTGFVDFAAADRSHTRINGSMGDAEVISIGEKYYSKLNNANWTESAAASASPGGLTIETMRQMLESVIKDAKYAGSETVNGVTCHAYTYAIDGDMSGQHWLGTGKSWIRASDGLPHRGDSELIISAHKTKSSMTYEYNVDFKVEKPPM
jgi:hypothetical protein